MRLSLLSLLLSSSTAFGPLPPTCPAADPKWKCVLQTIYTLILEGHVPEGVQCLVESCGLQAPANCITECVQDNLGGYFAPIRVSGARGGYECHRVRTERMGGWGEYEGGGGAGRGEEWKGGRGSGRRSRGEGGGLQWERSWGVGVSPVCVT